MKCNNCGGKCFETAPGVFECEFCGETFTAPKPKAHVEPVAVAQPTPKSADGGADVFEQNIDGILEIRWSDAQYTHSGSGFVISDSGYAVTNTHVVTYDNGRSVGTVTVKLCGESFPATVVALGDDRHGHGSGDDLALIRLSRIPFKTKVLQFEDFGNVRIGEQVFVVGNSLGYGTCITSGIVSDKARNVNGKTLLMTDCAVNGGNSGGPIFNAKGRIIGAIVAGIDGAEGMNFAIPASTVLDFIRRNNIKI